MRNKIKKMHKTIIQTDLKISLIEETNGILIVDSNKTIVPRTKVDNASILTISLIFFNIIIPYFQ